MSNEIEITVKGWVGQRPRMLDTRGGNTMLTMRVGSTPRRRDGASQAWVDGDTSWFSVLAFGDLAENAARSLRKGDPVLVRGRYSLKKSEHEGREFINAEIVADAIGPELGRGTALYAPMVRRAKDEAAAEPEAETDDEEYVPDLSFAVDLDDLSAAQLESEEPVGSA